MEATMPAVRVEVTEATKPADSASGRQSTVAAASAKSKPSVPKFIDVFGDTVREVNFLRNLSIALIGVSMILVIAVVKLVDKAPLVIRVDALRSPMAVSDIDANSAVTAPEVRNFAEHFTRDLLGWDLYTLQDDVERALAMMTPEARRKMEQYLHSVNVRAQVQDDSLRTKVVVEEISVEKDTPHAVRLKVRGSRSAESYQKKEFRRETIFEDTIVAKKTERSLATPWGLLVEEWSENVFKQSQTP